MLNYFEYDDDMRLYQKLYNLNDEYEINSEFLLWVFMLFSSLFFTSGLIYYAYNYILSGRLMSDSSSLKQTVYIVRRLPSENLDEDIVEYIKKNTKRPYKILSNKTYDNSVSNPDDRLFMRYMKKIYKSSYDIFLMNDNLNRIEYDNYIYFAEIMGVNYKILDFIKNTEEEDTHEYRRMNRENRERITIRLN
jgi:hypothetical protein